MSAVDVEVVLDLRDLADPPATPDGIAELWQIVERWLAGRELRAPAVHTVPVPVSGVRVEVVRVAAGVRAADLGTRYGVVAVREPARLRYRCRVCAGGGTAVYGPFSCAQGGADDRLCDRHAIFLEGALVPTCAEHRPSCSASPSCSRPAFFRCAGPRCGHEKAWCAVHRRQHPHDPDIAFCPPCHEIRFPECDAGGCRHIGTVRCEHVDAGTWRSCGRRSCPRHAVRWQVFGAERLGLSRCSEHSNLWDLTPGGVVMQIVAGAVARKKPQHLPGLTGFAHSLRGCGHRRQALEYTKIYGALVRMGERSDVPARIAAAVRASDKRWREQLAKTERDAERGRALVERLRGLIRADSTVLGDAGALAAAVSLAEYKKDRRLLFVDVADGLGGRLVGRNWERAHRLGDALGVVIQLEQDRAKS